MPFSFSIENKLMTELASQVWALPFFSLLGTSDVVASLVVETEWLKTILSGIISVVCY